MHDDPYCIRSATGAHRAQSPADARRRTILIGRARGRARQDRPHATVAAMSRVRIGACSGPVDVALVRSVFEAHGIPIVINAEQHASVLGGLGGTFLPLYIYVDDEHAEEAAALLADLRDRKADDPELAAEDDAEDDAAEDDAADDASAGAPADLHAQRRRRTGIALLFGCCVTFGTAHMATGAWFRGLALAGIEGLGLTHLFGGDADLGGVLFFGAIGADVVGALWRARVRTASPRLPVARVRR